MIFMEFIKSHAAELLLAAAAVVCAIVLVSKGYKERAKSILLSLVAAAEREWGSGTGPIKFSAVTEALYEKLPFIKIFVSESTLSYLIEEAVQTLKKYLDGGNIAQNDGFGE